METSFTEEGYKDYPAKKDTISNQRIRPEGQDIMDFLLENQDEFYTSPDRKSMGTREKERRAGRTLQRKQAIPYLRVQRSIA